MNFIIAAVVSTAVVLISPVMGLLQSFLRRSLTTNQYVWLFGIGVFAAVALAVVLAFVRIRERRAQRVALLAAALLLGAAYMWINGTPYPEVNAVERVHLVEYGLIAFLFYRAFKPRGDLSMLILPLLISFMVGTCDEWLQWFVPVRVGEAHDVFMNLAAIVCGLMFAVALQPPASFTWSASSRSLRAIGAAAAIAWLVFATFVAQVHLGYENDVAGIGRFRSHYTVDQLITLQKNRLNEWDANPPRVLRRISQEDQYLDEGIWHIRARNSGEPFQAWHENLILERYFSPVLDIPTYAAPSPNRWPIEQRRNVEAAAAGDHSTFISGAEPYPIVVWPRATYWSVVVVVAVVCAVMPMVLRRQRRVAFDA